MVLQKTASACDAVEDATLDLVHLRHENRNGQLCLAWPPCAGLAVCLGYQALYTAPRWRQLVGAHLAARGTTGTQALGLLAGFGAFYNVHNIAQVLGTSSHCCSDSMPSATHGLCRRLRANPQPNDSHADDPDCVQASQTPFIWDWSEFGASPSHACRRRTSSSCRPGTK